MAKKNQQSEVRSSITSTPSVNSTDNTAEAAQTSNLTSFGDKLQKRRKLILWISGGVLAVVAGILIWVFAFLKPSQHKAMVEAGLGDYELMQVNEQQGDSTLTAKHYAEALAHYTAAIEEGHAGGNRAKLMAAIVNYQTGNYDEAISLLEAYDDKDVYIAAAAKSLKGDCLVNLDKNSDAIAAYDEAIEKSNENPYFTPFFMLKKARVQSANGDHSSAASTYQSIYDNYAQYFGINLMALEKEIARENALAGK